MVELIPKQARKMLPWQNMLFYASLAAFVLAAGAYATLLYFVSQSSTKLKDLEGEIAQRGTFAEKQLEGAVLDVEARVGLFSKIIEGHRKPSRVFPIIEENTHPQVWFDFFRLSTETGLLELTGQASSFQSIGQQLNALMAADTIKGLKLSELSVGKEGKTEFTLNITFDTEIFK